MEHWLKIGSVMHLEEIRGYQFQLGSLQGSLAQRMFTLASNASY